MAMELIGNGQENKGWCALAWLNTKALDCSSMWPQQVLLPPWRTGFSALLPQFDFYAVLVAKEGISLLRSTVAFNLPDNSGQWAALPGKSCRDSLSPSLGAASKHVESRAKSAVALGPSILALTAIPYLCCIWWSLSRAPSCFQILLTLLLNNSYFTCSHLFFLLQDFWGGLLSAGANTLYKAPGLISFSRFLLFPSLEPILHTGPRLTGPTLSAVQLSFRQPSRAGCVT